MAAAGWSRGFCVCVCVCILDLQLEPAAYAERLVVSAPVLPASLPSEVRTVAFSVVSSPSWRIQLRWKQCV